VGVARLFRCDVNNERGGRGNNETVCLSLQMTVSGRTALLLGSIRGPLPALRKGLLDAGLEPGTDLFREFFTGRNPA
jgi:hypothetical protein